MNQLNRVLLIFAVLALALAGMIAGCDNNKSVLAPDSITASAVGKVAENNGIVITSTSVDNGKLNVNFDITVNTLSQEVTYQQGQKTITENVVLEVRWQVDVLKAGTPEAVYTKTFDSGSDGFQNLTESKSVSDIVIPAEAGDYDVRITAKQQIINSGDKNPSWGGGWQYQATKPNAVTVASPNTQADTTPPVITYNITGTIGNNGWYTSDVTVSWSVVDGESAITSETGSEATTITTDTAGTELICTATSAGGANSVKVTIKRDATAPTINISGPAVVLQGASASATVNAHDALSGLAVDPSGLMTLGASTLGSNTITANAVDNAGNSASASLTYTVWGIVGPFAPMVKAGNGSGQFKAGSTIPVKFQITNGTGLVTTASGLVSIGGASAAFRWDAIAQQYVANVNTAKGIVGDFNVGLSINLNLGLSSTSSMGSVTLTPVSLR